MNWIRKHAIATGTTLAVLSLLILAAPRTGHALVAALVQVTNTVAAPVVTQDVSKLASQNVQLVCISNLNCAQILADGSTPAQWYTVPAGSHFVIRTVQFNTPGTISATLLQYSGISSDRGDWTLSGSGSFQFQYPAGIVISSGSVLVISGQIDRTSLTGYLVSN